MRISKEGDAYLRTLLVQCAQHILSRRGPDTDLKRWGPEIAARGRKKAKRSVVAARKLAVLLHRLWVTGAVYEPLRKSRGCVEAVKAAAGGRGAGKRAADKETGRENEFGARTAREERSNVIPPPLSSPNSGRLRGRG